ncbi:hypothetical protein PhaeoP66_03254 [Phaeobacter inhibens]|uniref:Uncharacterized protein n=1 Tax=Phaeobacter inhibens TaxID=221822 RepID=A0ABN5GR61_9RHOB|nr:hypothetical protein PhaeoP66_03254 [Phaeobacter inhibens]
MTQREIETQHYWNTMHATLGLFRQRGYDPDVASDSRDELDLLARFTCSSRLRVLARRAADSCLSAAA